MIYSGGPLAADIPDIDLASFTLARAKELGGKPALIDGPSGRALSYADLERSVRSLAAGLTAGGFAKGDTFAIFMPNVPEYAVAFHGAAAAGGRCTTANPRYTARELGRQLADSRAKLLLTAPPFLDVARQAAAQAGNCEVFALGEAAGADRNLRAPGQGPRRRGHHPGHLHRGPGRRRAPRDEHRADAGGGPALLPAPDRIEIHHVTGYHVPAASPAAS